MDIGKLRRKFREHFETDGDNEQIFFAPGRVCLIGEHIDYNGGLVLPAALSLGIYALIQPDESDVLQLRSGISENEIIVDLSEEIVFTEKHGWGNYPLGVIKLLKEKGLRIPGGKILFESTLSTGAGLSSSAAIEVLTAFMFSHLNGDKISPLELAQLCKQVENDFVGVQCGIMDQFAVAMGKKNHAMMLNCHSLVHHYVPIVLGDYELVIFNTNKKRELTDSQFNVRTEECREAFETINKHRKIENLVDAEKEEIQALIKNPVVKRRALHVVEENKRVKEAGEALKKKDMLKFGDLLFKSHASLKQQYEVTGKELDAIEEAARNHPACVGAKMSGAGFGGCAFAIVKKTERQNFATYVLKEYEKKTGLTADFYLAEISDGVKKL